MQEKAPDWSKSYLVRPRNHLKSHVFIDDKIKFKVSYEKDSGPIPMKWLLGWEYSRQWLKERDAFCLARGNRSKMKHIKNDYEKWVAKRKPKEHFSCKPQGANKLAPKKLNKKLNENKKSP